MKTTLFLLAAAFAAIAATNETYTVQVGDGFPPFTNVVKYPTQHEPGCWLITYADKGVTNEFHAWLVNFTLKTNAASRK